MRDGVGEDAPLVGRSSWDAGHSTWDVESSSLWRIVQSLPPLPVPKRDREGQARLGILCSILFLGVILLPPLHAMDDTAYLPNKAQTLRTHTHAAHIRDIDTRPLGPTPVLTEPLLRAAAYYIYFGHRKTRADAERRLPSLLILSPRRVTS